MVNEVLLEGIVVRDPWKYQEDLFLRLVSYRDPDLPPKKLDPEHDAGDYITLRLPGAASGLLSIRRGMRLRVQGFLQSRDYRETLDDFTEKARRFHPDLRLELKPDGLLADRVGLERSLVELVVRRIVPLEGSSAPRSARPVRRPVAEQEPPGAAGIALPPDPPASAVADREEDPAGTMPSQTG